MSDDSRIFVVRFLKEFEGQIRYYELWDKDAGPCHTFNIDFARAYTGERFARQAANRMNCVLKRDVFGVLHVEDPLIYRDLKRTTQRLREL